jgi:GNAT superfamily N-acetyltransferase
MHANFLPAYGTDFISNNCLSEKENTVQELKIIYRSRVTHTDEQNVANIVQSTGFFSPDEIHIAVELVTERLQKGPESGYYFLFAESNRRTIGYSCFGPIPATKFSFDLYWIVVHDDWRGKGIGRRILEESEKAIKKLGGQRIYIETSGREQYRPTRSFYLSCGYKEEARLEDFYAPGDAKYFYVRALD